MNDAGQGAPVPVKAVFRSGQPYAVRVGDFQAEGAGKGQWAGEMGETRAQAALPQGAFQRGIDGFQQPGLAAFAAQRPDQTG